MTLHESSTGASSEADAARSGKVNRQRFPYRMKDLCELTGLERQVIHFYIQQGLVPEGYKTGRNMAYYGTEHVERLKLVRKLSRERFLPLKAIRAVLDGADDAFTTEQRALLHNVKQHLAGELGAGGEPRATVDAADVMERTGTTRDELQRFVDLGFLSAVEERGRLLLSADDIWMVELWSEIRDAGFSPELGFSVDDLAIFEDAMSTLFTRERELVLPRLSHLPASDVASMVRRALPLISTFLARYHLTKARNFFAAME